MGESITVRVTSPLLSGPVSVMVPVPDDFELTPEAAAYLKERVLVAIEETDRRQFGAAAMDILDLAIRAGNEGDDEAKRAVLDLVELFSF